MPKIYSPEALIKEAIAFANKDSFVNDSLEDKKTAIVVLNAYKENVVAKIEAALAKVEASIDIDDFNFDEEIVVTSSTGDIKVTKVKAQVKQNIDYFASSGATNEVLKSQFNLGDDLIFPKVTKIFSMNKKNLEAAYQNGDVNVAKAFASGQLTRSCNTVKDVKVTTKVKN